MHHDKRQATVEVVYVIAQALSIRTVLVAVRTLKARVVNVLNKHSQL